MPTQAVFEYCRTHATDIANVAPSGHETYSHEVYAVWEDGESQIQARQRDARLFGSGVPDFIGFKNCPTVAAVLAHVAECEQHEHED